MARKRAFAKTWWGERWLEALEKLGHFWPNRLPRGRTYARHGAVKEISITPSKIQAKVQGTRRTPYQVQIKIKSFSKKEKRILFKLLKKHAFLVSSLLQLQMPQELLSLLSAQGLNLIPDHPEEFKTSCSCPDWANPCKHIAAVFYTLTEAIDSDPFNLFLFRGMTREEVLGSLEIAERTAEESTPRFQPTPQEVRRFYQFRNEEDLPSLLLPKGAEDLIFSLLSENPVFYSEGDLKQALRQIYKTTKTLSLEEVSELRSDSIEPSQEAVFLLQKGTLFAVGQKKNGHRAILPRLMDGELVDRRVSGLRLSLEEALPWLLSSPLEAEGLSPSLTIYVYLSHLAWAMVTGGHFVPQVKRNGDSFWINFRPYYAFDEVKSIFQSVCKKAPLSSFLQGKSGAYAGPEEVLGRFLSESVDWLVKQWAITLQNSLFFKSHHIKGPVEEAFFQGLSAWLAPLGAPERGKKGTLSLLLKQARKYWYLSPLFKGQPLNQVFSDLPAAEKRELLDTLGILTSSFPVLSGLEEERGLKEKVRISTQDLLQLLHTGGGLLRALDIPVAVSGNLTLVERLKIKASTHKSSSMGKGVLSLDRVLSFNLKVALGDRELSFEELRRLLKEDHPLLRIGDEFYLLAPDELSRLQKALTATSSLSGPQAMLATLAREIAIAGERIPFEPPREATELFKRLKEEIPRIQPSPLIKAQLRPYQLQGFRWLVSTLQAGFGACLADDMGLGKTLQTICALVHLWEEKKVKRALVAAPTSLLGNWQQEFKRFAPEVPTLLYHGPTRKLSEEPVVITSYGILRSDQDEIVKTGFDLVVLDEAQNIKNPTAAQTQAVYRLASTPFRIALSGTPVENRLLELWSIFRFLNPGLLGSQIEFVEHFARPIEFLGDREVSKRLRQVVAPFVLRREKRDPSIVPDLPQKIERDEWCMLTPNQASLYQRVIDEVMGRIEGSEGIERKGLVLKLMLLLKQICDHPALYHKHLTGKAEESGKFLRLVELLEEIRSQGEKVLIFSQFRSMGEIICSETARLFGERPLFLHGGVPRKRREEMVALFERDHNPFAFVLSLKAGGTGLNLVSATHVIHYDLWWNPAVEVQATDRAYRIGQRETVMVHRLLTKHTLEEKINQLLLKKKALSSQIISSGERWITELSDKELRSLVSLSEGSL